MKSHVRRLVAVLLAVGSCVPALCAESKSHLTMRVPFAFQFGAQRFAPGTCRIYDVTPYVLQLKCGSSLGTAMVRDDIDFRTVRPGYALFRKYGDRYFLVEIRPSNSTARVRIYESGWEKQAARELEAERRSPTLVKLALIEARAVANR